jgi:tetratricopeptide (TPR) repeat protein
MKYDRITIIILLCVSILLYLTYERNKVWKSEKKIWYESLLLSPNKARPKNNYATFVVKENKFLKSYLLYKSTFNINPNYNYHKENLFRLFIDIGDIKSARELEVENIPYKHMLYYYTNLEMWQKAKMLLMKAMKSNIRNEDAYFYLSTALSFDNDEIYQKLKNYVDSLNILTYEDKIRLKVLESKNDSTFEYEKKWLDVLKKNEYKAGLLYDLARQSVTKGDFETAIKYITDALDLVSKSEYYHLRAAIFFNVGNFLYAAMDYTSAFKLSGDPEFVKYRAMCYEQMGHEESAKNEWRYYRILREKEGEKGEIPESTFGEGENSPGL